MFPARYYANDKWIIVKSSDEIPELKREITGEVVYPISSVAAFIAPSENRSENEIEYLDALCPGFRNYNDLLLKIESETIILRQRIKILQKTTEVASRNAESLDCLLWKKILEKHRYIKNFSDEVVSKIDYSYLLKEPYPVMMPNFCSK